MGNDAGLAGNADNAGFAGNAGIAGKNPNNLLTNILGYA